MRILLILAFSALTNGVRANEFEEAKNAQNVPLFSIPKTRAKIKIRGRELRSDISKLPFFVDRNLQTDRFGYHSDYLPELKKLPDEPRWTLDIEFSKYTGLVELFVVPAAERRYNDKYIKGAPYGFPKRLRVIKVNPDGTEILVWESMNEDFKQHTRLPLYVKMGLPRSNRVKIEVFKGEAVDGKEFFAIDEIIGMSQGDIRTAIKVRDSSELSSPPYWSKEYLIDQQTNLGVPAGDPDPNPALDNPGHFAVSFGTNQPESCSMELDFGKNIDLGWVGFYPAIEPGGTPIPGYGFPGRIDITVFAERNGHRKMPGISLNRWENRWNRGNPGDNVVPLSVLGSKARWIRIKFGDLPKHNGQYILAMGEIRTSLYGKSLPIQNIKLEGFPKMAEDELRWLTDGETEFRRIMNFNTWYFRLVDGNSLRYLHSKWLETDKILEERWNKFWLQLFSITGLVVLASTFSIIANAYIQRRRHIRSLRHQISTDLHDDVGALMGCNMLSAKFLQKSVSEGKELREVNRILNSTAKAIQAMRDIVWVSSDSQDSVNQLAIKLEETLDLYANDYKVSCQRDHLLKLADYRLKFTEKRDVLLFVKEALNNIRKHAEADEIKLGIKLKNNRLHISVKDNGRGFDSANVSSLSSGIGLTSMKDRAKHLKGNLTINSAINKGTEITLEFPIQKNQWVKLTGGHNDRNEPRSY